MHRYKHKTPFLEVKSVESTRAAAGAYVLWCEGWSEWRHGSRQVLALLFFNKDISVWIAIVSKFILWFFRLGSVSVFLLPNDRHNPELWQLEPGTPVPNELLFSLTRETGEVKITPVFNNTTSQQFEKVCQTDELNCTNEDMKFLVWYIVSLFFFPLNWKEKRENRFPNLYST